MQRFDNAHAVVALDLTIGRHTGVPLETRGAIARYDAAATCWRCTARPRCRIGTATASRRCSACDARQSAFVRGPCRRRLRHPRRTLSGGRAGLRRRAAFRRPVKWIEDRREHLIAANHSRQQQHRIRAAIDADGRILGIDDEFFHDNGAYMRTHAATVPDLAAAMLPGPYRVPAYRAVGHIRLTNKTPCGTYRAPGRYEATFVRERLLDAIAAKVGDRQSRNPPPQSDRQKRDAATRWAWTRSARISSTIPATTRCCSTRRSSSPAGTALQEQLSKRRAAGELVGAGVAMFVEKSGLGPFDTVRDRGQAGRQSKSSPATPPSARASRPSWRKSAPTGWASTTGDIRVIHGQTDRIARGMGAFASRVTVMCGEATRHGRGQAARQGARRWPPS